MSEIGAAAAETPWPHSPGGTGTNAGTDAKSDGDYWRVVIEISGPQGVYSSVYVSVGQTSEEAIDAALIRMGELEVGYAPIQVWAAPKRHCSEPVSLQRVQYPSFRRDGADAPSPA